LQDSFSVSHQKELIREHVWRSLEERNIAAFPRPVFHRIPNFIGAEEAARRLAATKEFKNAEAVKVNPDSPQRHVRFEVLAHGKVLLMPTPRLRDGFILLDHTVPADRLHFASSIRGALVLGRKISLDELPEIDLAIVGSVAVARDGERIGKGEGYSEMEYAILRELDLIRESVPIMTTVHELQVVESVPHEDHDVAVDYIVTPKRILEIKALRRRPQGITWSKVTPEMMQRMPVLGQLRRRLDG